MRLRVLLLAKNRDISCCLLSVLGYVDDIAAGGQIFREAKHSKGSNNVTVFVDVVLAEGGFPL